MNNTSPAKTRRLILILTSAIDALISGFILLIYFGLLPIDLSSWGIPQWVVGVVGGAWFVVSIGILLYQLTKPDIE